MTVEDAQEFFKAVPSIREKMDALVRVGLGYIKVGQQATTLSGGEAQRVKLSKELSKRSTGRTLYILDEPTTGLHFDDVRKLLEVLHELVDAGNSVVVIEHNLDVIKTADWIIDIGPEGGDAGGNIVGVGTPETLSKKQKSHTGHYLNEVLNTSK
jgi:excinuclease ABC subunit A